MIKDRFEAGCASYEAAECIIDTLAHNGGLFLYDKYLGTKDNPHCSQRLIQFFEEGIQVKDT